MDMHTILAAMKTGEVTFYDPKERALVLQAELQGYARWIKSERHSITAGLTDKGRKAVGSLRPGTRLRETAGAGLILDRTPYAGCIIHFVQD